MLFDPLSPRDVDSTVLALLLLKDHFCLEDGLGLLEVFINDLSFFPVPLRF